MTITPFIILAIPTVWLLTLIGPEALIPITAFVALILVIAALLLIAHTAWRLIDPRKIVMLSTDRTACVDVKFNRRTVTLSNHGRLIHTQSAHPLRENVGAWLVSLAVRGVVIKAQNRKVARLYQQQFPQLRTVDTDLFGRVELSAE